MIKLILSLALLFICVNSYGQDSTTSKITDEIVAEGKRLYRSEKASWIGSDIFIEQYTEKEKIGGYFSYSDGDTTRNIFFSKELSPKVIGTMSFDSTFSITFARVDLSVRKFSKLESDIFIVRTKALQELNRDTLFKRYSNTELNLVPIFSGNKKKVYVLTGPKKNGVVIFGNDYLLTFDDDNNLVEKKQLHQNILSFPYGEDNSYGEKTGETMHTHLPETGDFITPTDICTLMLYEKYAKWKIHTVVSKNYFSFWSCEKDQLLVLTREAVEKITKEEEERRSEKSKQSK